MSFALFYLYGCTGGMVLASTIRCMSVCWVAITSYRDLRDAILSYPTHSCWKPLRQDSLLTRNKINLDQLKHNGDSIEQVQGSLPEQEIQRNQEVASQRQKCFSLYFQITMMSNFYFSFWYFFILSSFYQQVFSVANKRNFSCIRRALWPCHFFFFPFIEI